MLRANAQVHSYKPLGGQDSEDRAMRFRRMPSPDAQGRTEFRTPVSCDPIKKITTYAEHFSKITMIIMFCWASISREAGKCHLLLTPPSISVIHPTHTHTHTGMVLGALNGPPWRWDPTHTPIYKDGAQCFLLQKDARPISLCFCVATRSCLPAPLPFHCPQGDLTMS